MIRQDTLMQACDAVDSAAMLGEGWEDALELLARAAGSRGVMIMHNRHRKLVSFVCDKSIAEPVQDYLDGKAPPNLRQSQIRHDFDPGFRLDYDDFDRGLIDRDPYYQEWLRPLGMQWHANARLMMEGASEIAISFKRALTHGHYDLADKLALDSVLPRLRAASNLAECVFDAEARGMVKALHQRGRPVLEFDRFSRVRRQHGIFDGRENPIIVRRGQATSIEPHTQANLSQAIAKAVTTPQKASIVCLSDSGGQRYFFQLVPVVGRARDVFFATAAIGVLIGRPSLNGADLDMALASELFTLTTRESQIARLLCAGLSTLEIAANLSVVAETVRFHLKSIFEKTGGRSRSEVVAMLSRLVL